jgi:hypothetical protein
MKSIEAYIKTYHYANFEQAYKRFDRINMLLVDKNAVVQNEKLKDNYERFSYLRTLKTRDL